MIEGGDTEENRGAANQPLRSTVSPQPLATDLRSADGRDLPSRTDALAGALSQVIGGPVGRHALIGRARFLTPLRVMLVIAVVFLALGYSTKAACLVTTGSGTADQKVANWQNQRAYYEMCYSDTVPLYTAELLNLGKFPYKSSWIETDSEGRPQKQFDGNIAVRYMEYPVITGVYQYLSMALAKTYSALTQVGPGSVDRRGGDVLQHLRSRACAGMVRDGVVDRETGGQTHLGCGAGRRIADPDLSDLHQLRRSGNGFRGGRHLCLGSTKTHAGRSPDRVGGGGQALSDLAADPVGDPRCAHRTASGSGQDGGSGGHRLAAGQSACDAAVPAGVVGVLPAQRPSRRRHGLVVQRGEVVHRLARLRHQPGAVGAAGHPQRASSWCCSCCVVRVSLTLR